MILELLWETDSVNNINSITPDFWENTVYILI